MLGLFRRKQLQVNGNAIPSETVQWLQNNTQIHRTPDIAALERRSHHLLFVYDETLRDHPRKDILQDCEELCTAFTTEDFALWKFKLGIESYPIALENEFKTVRSAKIKGKLYKVYSSKFLELDLHKVNGVEFTRLRTTLRVPYHYRGWTEWYKEHGKAVPPPKQEQTLRAWMYVGISDYWHPLLDAGANFGLVRCFRPNKYFKHDYYCYTPMEYDEEGLKR